MLLDIKKTNNAARHILKDIFNSVLTYSFFIAVNIIEPRRTITNGIRKTDNGTYVVVVLFRFNIKDRQ